MNLIRNEETTLPHLIPVPAVMLGIGLRLLRRARRQGWW
jgi:hypothetical protein